MDFEDDDYYTGPPLRDDVVTVVEGQLGVRLPEAYIAVLRERNGGVPRLRCWPTGFPTSWAPDHFEIRAILGIGGEWGIDSPTQGSTVMLKEWGYPDIGVVICDTPSGGHDTVMLDYRGCGAEGEPAVAYIDEDRTVRVIAASFSDFVSGLTDCARDAG